MSVEIPKILGIDVGLKSSWFVVLEGRKIIDSGVLSDLPDANFAGIDAPLSFPEKGALRECEKELLRRGIPLFPSGATFFRKIGEKGIELARELKRRGAEVYEVYPYATRFILGIAPEAKKNRKDGLMKIEEELRSHLEFEELENHHLVDAALSALTVYLFLKGDAEVISGRDGNILIPASESPSNVDVVFRAQNPDFQF